MGKINARRRTVYLCCSSLICNLLFGQIAIPDTVVILNDSKVTHINSSNDVRGYTTGDNSLIAYRTNSNRINYKVFSNEDYKLVDSGCFRLEGIEFDDIKAVAFQQTRNVIGVITFDSLFLLSSLNGAKEFSAPLKRINYIELSKDYIFIAAYYNYNPLDRKHTFAIYKFDYKLNCLDSLDANPEFIEYTHYKPSHLFSANTKFISYPLLGEYGVVIMDYNLQIIDTVRNEINNWTSPSLKLSKLIKLNGRDAGPYFNLLDKENNSRISRIEYTQFLSDSVLLVRYFKFDSSISLPLRYIDIYSIKTKVDAIEGDTNILISLVNSYLEDRIPFDTKSCIDSVGFPVLSWTNYSSYYGNGIWQVRPEFENVPYKGLSYMDYFQFREANILSNDPILTLWFYRVK